MTAMGWDYMGEEPQLFRRTVGEALARLVRTKWPRDTAKHVSRAWGLDPKTAANVIQGHASERTITKAIAAEGWALLDPLGEALTGVTYEQHLSTLAQEADRVRDRIEARRERVSHLQRQAAGAVALPPWGGDGLVG